MYRVEFTSAAARQVRKLDLPVRTRLLNADDDGCQVSILCDADPLAAVGSAPEDVGEVGA